MSWFARSLPLFLLTFCATAQLQPVYQKMDEAAATFHSLTADTVKQHYTAVADATETSKGTLAVRRDKPKELKALFRITEPAPQQMAFGGKTGKVYYPKTNILEIYDLDKKLGSTVNDYLLLGFGGNSKDLQQSYNITLGGPEAINGQKATRLVLKPKKSGDLAQAELWISDQTGIAVQQKFYWQGGDYDLATYSNMKINPSIPDSAIELNPPGAKIEHPLK
jgi:outer membrane lipoprotein-sorting protein